MFFNLQTQKYIGFWKQIQHFFEEHGTRGDELSLNLATRL